MSKTMLRAKHRAINRSDKVLVVKVLILVGETDNKKTKKWINNSREVPGSVPTLIRVVRVAGL